ncbi:pyrroline-5-carboxylate reductase [Exophiala viscosa]|uniref:Pyrroline-5-carboxylate reductase n=1 Tax=Exophiala viscosa TaxID=2486360 RepID=A0AAN6ICK2_9EURO|nr:pyrroline-5-carboxylate reductase [Exophiala viscosa]KAI1624422.1 pyrroline-5-carboxylate reductase [Exophiala viscosa]
MNTTSTARKLRIAILGCGFMGTALLSGILKNITHSQHEVHFSVTASSYASLRRLDKKFAGQRDQVVVITGDNVEAAKPSEVVILGFQPQQLAEILSNSALLEAIRGKLVISLLAGISSRQITQTIYPNAELSEENRVARVIPSIGAQIRESMTLVAETPLSSSDSDLVAWLFQQVGRTQHVPEELINTVTAVSAACHALTVVAVDAIVDGSVAEGVPRQMALDVAAQCLRSSSTLLQGHMSIESLKESMSVARGITINALLQLDRGHVRPGISDAVTHAVHYAQEFTKAE